MKTYTFLAAGQRVGVRSSSLHTALQRLGHHLERTLGNRIGSKGSRNGRYNLHIVLEGIG